MYNIVIASYTNSVIYNQSSLTDLNNLPIPPNTKALYWDEGNNTGWIENTDDNGVYIGNTDITELPQWATECVNIFKEEWSRAYPEPTPEEICKYTAESLLRDTDWAEIPSVSNTANNPHLLNLNEFLAYRTAVRALAVNPVADPVFPPVPTAQWSAQE